MERQPDKYDRLFEELESSEQFWVEAALTEFMAEFSDRMAQRGITRSKLARILGKTPAYVTKMLDGNGNYTLTTIVRLALAVGGVLHLHIANPEALTRWVDEYSTPDVARVVSVRLGPKPYSIALAVNHSGDTAPVADYAHG